MMTQSVEFKTYLPSESRYSARIKPEEWERHREKLIRLHKQNIPRRQMLDILKREDDFVASLPQLNGRFNTWGLRRYEKSTSISGRSAHASHSQTPSTDRYQSTVSPLASAMTTPQHPAGGPADEAQSPQLDLEGVGGEFSGALEEAGHVDADNTEILWAHIQGPGFDAIDNGPDFAIRRSGYLRPEYLPDSFQRLSDGDTSSSDGLGILTPGTSTPSRASTSSISSQTSPLAQRPGLSSEDGQSSESDHKDHTAGSSQALSCLTRPTAPQPYAQIQLPTDMHVTESLLRCVGDFASLMKCDRQKTSPTPSSFLPPRNSASPHFRGDIHRQQIKRCINATAEAYESAHYFLKLGEPIKAIQRLYDATPTIAPMLVEPDLFLLTRLVEIATWSSWKKFPGYEPVVFKFLSREAGKQLGLQHPLALLLGCFAQAAAISKSYPTLWTVIIDHIDRIADDSDPASRSEAQQIRIKAYFYLVRVLRNNGHYFQAIQRCQELIQLCIAIDGTRSFLANRARYNLAINHCEASDLQSAMAAYREVRKHLGTKDSPSDGWVFAVFASSELAQLHEEEEEMDKAAKYYEEALVSFLECGGDESSGALLMLKDLIEFHERMDNKEQIKRVKRQYPACCTALEMGGLDDARHWVGRRVTTQASGGKKWRAWTWTSPIT